MSDATVALIADYAHALHFSDLPSAVISHCKRCLIDTFGVALGAFHAEPSRIARLLAERCEVPSGARVIGTTHRTLPELAAFANSVMARYLDGNDTFPVDGGHPSDMIPGVLAAAEQSNADGQTIVTAITLSYEVYYNVWRSVPLRDKGMDNVFYVTIGTAAGAAKALGLDRKRTAEAISLAVTPNIALDATRYGQLSMWKGCAGGNSARNGVFAALLAAQGMTGPEKPMEGAHGLENLAGKIQLSAFGGDGRPFRITENTLKCYLASGFSNAAIAVALQLSKQVSASEIAEINVHTAWFAWDVSGREPEKWRPTTRETADHSIPYVVAAMLIDRKFSDEIFAEERLRDPHILELIDKIKVKEDPDYTRRLPLGQPCRIEILTKSGERKEIGADYPRGHYNNPMTDTEINDKFYSLANRALPRERMDRALEVLWRLDSARDLKAIFDAVVV